MLSAPLPPPISSRAEVRLGAKQRRHPPIAWTTLFPTFRSELVSGVLPSFAPVQSCFLASSHRVQSQHRQVSGASASSFAVLDVRSRGSALLIVHCWLVLPFQAQYFGLLCRCSCPCFSCDVSLVFRLSGELVRSALVGLISEYSMWLFFLACCALH